MESNGSGTLCSHSNRTASILFHAHNIPSSIAAACDMAWWEAHLCLLLFSPHHNHHHHLFLPLKKKRKPEKSWHQNSSSSPSSERRWGGFRDLSLFAAVAATVVESFRSRWIIVDFLILSYSCLSALSLSLFLCLLVNIRHQEYSRTKTFLETWANLISFGRIRDQLNDGSFASWYTAWEEYHRSHFLPRFPNWYKDHDKLCILSRMSDKVTSRIDCRRSSSWPQKRVHRWGISCLVVKVKTGLT